MSEMAAFKEGNDIKWYRTEVPREVMRHLNERSDWKALRQADPWKGQHPVTNNAWCREQLHAMIESLDWRQAREDVRRFVKPAELPSLQLWSREFFQNQCLKLGSQE